MCVCVYRITWVAPMIAAICRKKRMGIDLVPLDVQCNFECTRDAQNIFPLLGQ